MQKKSIILIICYLFIFYVPAGCAQKKSMEGEIIHEENKIIPEKIADEARTALFYYPELREVEIEFKFKEKIEKSFMQAQPQIGNLFKGKNRRSYNVLISSNVHIEGKDFSVDDIPSEVLIGWLGHELGHIMDYREKTAFGLIIFGVRYITSSNYIKRAERDADTYAVNQGMGEYILKTKNFILHHTDLSEAYKSRIKRLYLSPEEIVVLVNKLEEDIEEAEKIED